MHRPKFASGSESPTRRRSSLPSKPPADGSSREILLLRRDLKNLKSRLDALERHHTTHLLCHARGVVDEYARCVFPPPEQAPEHLRKQPEWMGP
jgi:hypothetical protein